MDQNNPWYTPPTHPQHRRSNTGTSNEQSPIPNSRGFTNVASQTVQNAQQLLASYPMASAAPTVHAARHLGSLNITAAPPSYAQPSYYSSQPHPGYMGGNSRPPPTYTDYNHQISYLSAPQVPSNQRGYWEDARDTSVRLLNEQANHSYNFQPPRQQQQQHWPQSTYQSPAFSQSVFQRTVPTTAYPTPPPPGINTSSSSLAYALGTPTHHAGSSAQPPPYVPVHRPHNPADSDSFFNGFLEKKRVEMKAVAPVAKPSRPVATMAPPPPPRTPPPKAKPVMSEDSPDPLALRSKSSTQANVSVTPQKRKPVVEIQSPSAKRMQSYQSMTGFFKSPNSSSGTPRTPGTTVPLTPSTTSRTNTSQASSSRLLTSNSKTPTANGAVTPTPNRIVNRAYVYVPPSPFLTPSSSRKGHNGVKSDTPDLGGYGSEEDHLASPSRRRTLLDSAKGSARRTGDRDERGPLEKFVSAVEEVFEMEDSLPVEVEAGDLPQDYFSLLSTDCSRPLLSTALIRKLSKYIGQAARPSKRMRQASAGGLLATPRGRTGRMADVDVQLLSRLLKILDRSVKAGEDLDPFPQAAATVASGSGVASARTSPVKKSRKSKKVKDGEEDNDGVDDADLAEEQGPKDSSSSVVDEVELEKLTRILDIARDSIVAADCCIALLASDRLPKQLYSEELITGCLNTIKGRLTKILYPFVEACSPEAISNKLLGINPLLIYLVKPTAGSGSAYASSSSQAHHRQQMSDLFQALSAVLPKINALVNAESVAMSDSIIIQTVYIAIGPFFVVEPGAEHDSLSRASVSRKEKEKEKDSIVNKTLGKSAMRGLRLDALSLIRSIFANHDDQRSWVIEEILSSLIKLSDTKQKAGQFRLRDGRSIRTVSALLLQLVQTSAHDVRLHARAIEKRRQAKFALKRQESFSESQGQQQPEEAFLDEIDMDEIRLYGTGLESATKAAKTIILFLNSRSGKGKATKNSNEAEYRAIFDNLIEDVLAVLYWPEWPAAGLLLSIASKFMVSSLDDVKSSSSQGDSNAAKTMALDHLGVIAARIRSSILKVQKGTSENDPKYRDLRPLDEVVSSRDPKQFAKVMEAHKDVAAHLCKRSYEDQAYDSARELTAATLCQELAAGLKQVNMSLEHPDEDDGPNPRDQSKLLAFGRKLKASLRDAWKDPATDVFDIGSQEEGSRIDRLAEEIGTIQSLKNSFHPVLNVILMALDAPAIFMRTKALRALGQIVTSDSTILAAPNVRRGIESHLLDSSPAVRDAAVELIGKYMIDSPEVAGDYYQKIADRMADTGLGVRKRVIKLLKSFCTVTDDTQRKIDICTRLVLRMMDEDDTVKDLAAKTIEELWFPPAPLQSAMKGKSGAQTNQEKSALLTKVSVIMGTAANFKDRQSPLEEILHKIIVGREGNEATSLHERYTEICETLIDGLVDATDLPGFTIINCIRTIYLFGSAYPAILSGSNASTLLPYLKNASTSEEVATSDYLLKIFRVSVPHMPKTAAKFGHELQSSLQPMIIKPSGGGGIHVLQEAVACMCVVVDHLTHDFSLLINLLKSCNARLLAFLRLNAAPADIRSMLMLIFIVALLGEHCNFDRLRKERENLAADINAISEGSIMEHIYLALLRIYNKFDNGTLRGRILQCLGFLFRAQPTLMTKEQSADIMDAIFDSPEEEGRGRLLRIMQDFLISESEKHSAKEKESTKNKNKTTDINMDELVGNTDGFADSGVSSAIVQRYLTHILDAALSQNAQIQAAAIDVLTFTIKQGLAHPLQSFPVIIALETSTYPQISNRAAALHSILNAKHASLINTRYSISARKSFDYQKKIIAGPVKGFRVSPTPIALLQRWYSLVREKRQTRQDFLKSMVKVFAENETYQATQDDVDFTRYMAENFATFEYKTQEEVFTVVKYLTTVLSTTGMQLLDIISPAHLLSHLHGTQPAAPPPSATPSMETIPGSSTSETMDVDGTSGTQNMPAPAAQQAKIEGRDLISLMRTSISIAMVMLLKSHLKTLYSLSEDKCNKFVIGKKSAVGDKPAVKRHENPISWDRLTYAVIPIHTTHDTELQKSTFLEIWNEDGVSAEPEDEDLLS